MDPQAENKPGGLKPADIYPGGAPTKENIPAATPSPAPAGPSKPPAPSRPGGNWASVASTLMLFLLAPAVALGIAAFVIQSYQVDGESMETTLDNNDRLIVDKLPRTWARITHHDYIPQRGNIIIFNESGLPDAGPSGEKQLIKRVVGLPGDHVVVNNDHLTIYNKAHPGGFDPDKSGLYTIAAANNTPGNVDVTLGKNQLFVCGDNRPNSEDSRFFGPINASQIVGKLVLRLLPANQIEKF